MEEKELEQIAKASGQSKEKYLHLYQQRMNLESQLHNGVTWFYWIAGLSIVNSVVTLIGTDWNFVVGMGITQIIDAFAFEASTSGKIIALIINVIIAGGYGILGLISRKRKTWVFIFGMVLYGLDSLIFIMIQDWISIAFHALAIYGFFRAIGAIKKLRKMDEAVENIEE